MHLLITVSSWIGLEGGYKSQWSGLCSRKKCCWSSCSTHLSLNLLPRSIFSSCGKSGNIISPLVSVYFVWIYSECWIHLYFILTIPNMGKLRALRQIWKWVHNYFKASKIQEPVETEHRIQPHVWQKLFCILQRRFGTNSKQSWYSNEP